MKESKKQKEIHQVSRRSKRIKKTNPKYENGISDLKLKEQKSKAEKVNHKKARQDKG